MGILMRFLAIGFAFAISASAAVPSTAAGDEAASPSTSQEETVGSLIDQAIADTVANMDAPSETEQQYVSPHLSPPRSSSRTKADVDDPLYRNAVDIDWRGTLEPFFHREETATRRSLRRGPETGSAGSATTVPFWHVGTEPAERTTTGERSTDELVKQAVDAIKARSSNEEITGPLSDAERKAKHEKEASNAKAEPQRRNPKRPTPNPKPRGRSRPTDAPRANFIHRAIFGAPAPPDDDAEFGRDFWKDPLRTSTQGSSTPSPPRLASVGTTLAVLRDNDLRKHIVDVSNRTIVAFERFLQVVRVATSLRMKFAMRTVQARKTKTATKNGGAPYQGLSSTSHQAKEPASFDPAKLRRKAAENGKMKSGSTKTTPRESEPAVEDVLAERVRREFVGVATELKRLDEENTALALASTAFDDECADIRRSLSLIVLHFMSWQEERRAALEPTLVKHPWRRLSADLEVNVKDARRLVDDDAGILRKRVVIEAVHQNAQMSVPDMLNLFAKLMSERHDSKTTKTEAKAKDAHKDAGSRGPKSKLDPAKTTTTSPIESGAEPDEAPLKPTRYDIRKQRTEHKGRNEMKGTRGGGRATGLKAEDVADSVMSVLEEMSHSDTVSIDAEHSSARAQAKRSAYLLGRRLEAIQQLFDANNFKPYESGHPQSLWRPKGAKPPKLEPWSLLSESDIPDATNVITASKGRDKARRRESPSKQVTSYLRRALTPIGATCVTEVTRLLQVIDDVKNNGQTVLPEEVVHDAKEAPFEDPNMWVSDAERRAMRVGSSATPNGASSASPPDDSSRSSPSSSSASSSEQRAAAEEKPPRPLTTAEEQQRDIGGGLLPLEPLMDAEELATVQWDDIEEEALAAVTAASEF